LIFPLAGFKQNLPGQDWSISLEENTDPANQMFHAMPKDACDRVRAVRLKFYGHFLLPYGPENHDDGCAQGGLAERYAS